MGGATVPNGAEPWAAIPAQFAGRFDGVATLGEGAMGVVVRALDRVRRHDVALKFLRRMQPASLYRFKQEFRLLAELVHPNLVTLYELIVESEHWAVSMELVAGARPFLDYVRPYSHLLSTPDGLADVGPPESTSARRSHDDPYADDDSTIIDECFAAAALTTATKQVSYDLRFGTQSAAGARKRAAIRAAELNLDRLRSGVHQLVDGLDTVHRSGLLHRDIKPSNVLVDRVGRVVVCDFGLVVSAADVRHDKSGTPSYMAPEQAEHGVATPSSDYYSVGVMLYEALTGVLPITGRSVQELLELKRTAQIPAARELVPDVDDRLDDLCTALLDRDPGRRPDAAQIRRTLSVAPAVSCPGLSPAAMTELSVFVGRERECAVLRAALADARAGATVTVFVSGTSGVGKSALVAAACDEMRSQSGAVVFAGRCYQTESVPFKALDAVVDELARFLHDVDAIDAASLLPEGIAALCELFPVLRRARAVADAVAHDREPLPAHLVRPRAQIALRQLVQALARRRPIVIVVDDLQWGDLDTEPFLRELIESAEMPGALIIATCRTDPARPDHIAAAGLPGALLETTAVGAERDLRMLALGPLDRRDATQLVTAIAGDRRADVPDQLLDDAGGNPLFVAELAYAARTGQLIDSTGGLDELLARRIAALPADAQRLLEAAAVAAWPQPVALLSRALELRAEASVLAELRVSRMVRVVDSRDGELLTTYHDRIRETAVARLSERDRRRLHRRLARAFERASELDFEALAAHWAGAGAPDRAGHYALRAGQNAVAARAYRRAAHHYGQALELCDLDDGARLSVQRARANALFLAGAVRDAADAYNRIADVVASEDRALFRGQALICLFRAGDVAAADRLARAAGEEIQIRVPRSKLGALAYIAWGRLMLALRRARSFDPTPVPVPTEAARCMTLAKHVTTALGLTDPIRGFAVHTRYVRDALRYGDPHQLVNALAQEVTYTAAMHGGGAARRIRTLLEAADRAANATGDDVYKAVVAGYCGIAGFLSMEGYEDIGSQLDDVLPRVERDLELVHEADIVRLYAVNAYGGAGAFSTLTERLPALMKRARDTGNEYLREGLSRQFGVLIHLAHDRPDRAHASLHSARPSDVGRVTVNTYYFEINSAEVQAYEGRWMDALVRMVALWAAMRGTSVARVPAILCRSAAVLGRLYAVAAAIDSGAAVAHRRGARAMARQLDRLRRKLPTMARAQAAYVRGLLAAGAGDDARCVAHLRTALAGLEQCQAGLHAVPVRHQLALLVGGDEGRALTRATRRWAADEGVANLDRFATWLCPVDVCRRSGR